MVDKFRSIYDYVYHTVSKKEDKSNMKIDFKDKRMTLNFDIKYM